MAARATRKRATSRTGAAPLACSFVCSEMEEVETHDDEVIFDYLHATAFQAPLTAPFSALAPCELASRSFTRLNRPSAPRLALRREIALLHLATRRIPDGMVCQSFSLSLTHLRAYGSCWCPRRPLLAGRGGAGRGGADEVGRVLHI